MTSNNKVDARALPPPGRARPTLARPFAPPRTPIEEQVAAIWAEVLDLERVGMHDSFFELGGNSLLVTDIISRIVDTCRVALPIGTLLAAPTVAEMALAITQAHAGEVGQEQIAEMLTELERLLPREPRGDSPRRAGHTPIAGS
jgi:acyl carrier protein